jgi:hypothetical protein
MLATAGAMADVFREFFEDDHERVVVYADPDGETVLHEGAATVRANGWVELPSGRLLSPSAVHHIDTHPNAA